MMMWKGKGRVWGKWTGEVGGRDGTVVGESEGKKGIGRRRAGKQKRKEGHVLSFF